MAELTFPGHKNGGSFGASDIATLNSASPRPYVIWPVAARLGGGLLTWNKIQPGTCRIEWTNYPLDRIQKDSARWFGFHESDQLDSGFVYLPAAIEAIRVTRISGEWELVLTAQ